MIIIIIQLLLYNDTDTVKYILKAYVSTGRGHCQVSIQTNNIENLLGKMNLKLSLEHCEEYFR